MDSLGDCRWNNIGNNYSLCCHVNKHPHPHSLGTSRGNVLVLKQPTRWRLWNRMAASFHNSHVVLRPNMVTFLLSFPPPHTCLLFYSIMWGFYSVEQGGCIHNSGLPGSRRSRDSSLMLPESFLFFHTTLTRAKCTSDDRTEVKRPSSHHQRRSSEQQHDGEPGFVQLPGLPGYNSPGQSSVIVTLACWVIANHASGPNIRNTPTSATQFFRKIQSPEPSCSLHPKATFTTLMTDQVWTVNWFPTSCHYKWKLDNEWSGRPPAGLISKQILLIHVSIQLKSGNIKTAGGEKKMFKAVRCFLGQDVDSMIRKCPKKVRDN